MGERNLSSGSGSLAILIDGDNVSPTVISGLLLEIASLGVASLKRVYGDWTKPNLSGWKDCLLKHSIQPVQQFAYTTGKNATDGAMIIDAMDLLYTGRFSGFCIVSSDSDFTRLAARIREQGITVYGFGERKTPQPFITACDKFVYFDVLTQPTPRVPAPQTPASKAPASKVQTSKDSAPKSPSSKALASKAPASKAPALKAKPLTQKVMPTEKKTEFDQATLSLLATAVAASADESGVANLGQVGHFLSKQLPDFDPRNYGFARLSDLFDATGIAKIERIGENPQSVMVRLIKRLS